MIKLARLPDRTPLKMTITIMPDLDEALRAYAGYYKESYGKDEPLSTLIPAMLEAFLANDRDFAKSQRKSRKSLISK